MKNQSYKREKLKKLLPHHFYMVEGKVVFTKEYHIERGYCCGNKCLNCPFEPKHIKNNITLSKN